MLTLWPRELSLRSIRGRLAVLLAIVLLPVGAIAFHAGLNALRARHEAVQGEEGARISQALSSVRDQVTQLREIARSLAANADLFADNRRACQTNLAQFASEFPHIEIIAVMDQSAIMRCANVLAAQGQRAEARALINQSEETHDAVVGYVSAPHLSSQAVLGAVAPLPSASEAGEALYVGATRFVGPLLQAAAASVPRSGSYAILVDGSGDILQADGMPAELQDRDRLQAVLRGHAPYDFETAFRVGETWAVGAPLEEGRLYMLVGWTPVPLTLSEATLAVWSLLAPILLWLGGVAAAWYAVDAFVARPLMSVERLARAYARGGATEKEEEQLRNAPQEIASLRRTLAAMAKTLRGRESRLAESLNEERALLREINHRVKNNLQLVASILSIQARASTDTAEARGLARAQDRVHLLALVHTRIYASGEVRLIALDVLTQDIGRSLIASRQTHERQLQLHLDLAQVRVGVDKAVPYAFLVGEAMLYLLESRANGGSVDIAISLKELADRKIEFAISGADWPVAEANDTAPRMIAAFARQLDAHAEDLKDGMRFVWTEPDEDDVTSSFEG
jgi:two-component sensor histidine kinase